MKTILVTGGAGFIGSNFVRHLYRKHADYRLIVVDSLTYAGNVQNCPDGAIPYQHLEKAIPRFITSCILKEPLTVHGDGSAKRDWIFVEEHCHALDCLLDVELDKIAGQVMNIGTGTDKSILEVAEAVLEVMKPNESRIQFIGDRPGQVFRHTCDASKMKRLLGCEPRLSFEEGLERTIRWYRENESWWRPQMWMRHIPIVTAKGKREMH